MNAEHDRPSLLYHYTTASAMVSIIREGQLWATDLRFLNDARELELAKELLVEELQRLPLPDPGAYRPPDGNPLDDETAFRREVERMLLDGLDDFRCYVACFCEDGDLLSQWRGYASGEGVAIGFDVAALGASIPIETDEQVAHLEVDLRRVEYDEAVSRALLAERAKQINERRPGHPFIAAWYEIWGLLLDLAATKHHAFREEREWRIIVPSTSADLTNDRNRGKLKFRQSPLGLVPYQCVTFDVRSIREIRVGPGAHAALRASALFDFLNSQLGNTQQVEIIPSEAPFRG